MTHAPRSLLRPTAATAALSAVALLAITCSGCGDGSASSPATAPPTTSPAPAPAPAPSPSPAPSPKAGSGKTTYSCPPGSIEVRPGDDAAAVINGAPAGAAICIHGRHHVATTLLPKDGQTWVGVGADACLSGGGELLGWTEVEPGVWAYDGPFASVQNVKDEFANATFACFEVSTYQDDVFYGDRRMMRVLSLDQLKGLAPLPRGQAECDGEYGRFFFDYANDVIYIDEDPTGVAMELAVLDVLVSGAGASGVTIQNLCLEKARSFIVDGKFAGPSQSWVMEDCTVRFAHNIGVAAGAGVQGAPTVFRRVLATNNGQTGLTGGGSWFVLEGCELSWNNIANYRKERSPGVCGGYWGAGAAKFVVNNRGSAAAPSLEVIDLVSHHNIGDGFWTDIGNNHVRVAGGRLHDNERNGYFHEISCAIEITGVEIDHNGTPIKNTDFDGGGITVLDSNDAWIHGNWIHDNASHGVRLKWQVHDNMLAAACLNAAHDTDVSGALLDNLVEDNDIRQCGGGFAASGTGTARLSQRNNWFRDNRYTTDGGAVFEDAGRALTWADWQAAGHDLQGSDGRCP